MRGKRILSALLTLVLVWALCLPAIPLSARAATTLSEGGGSNQYQINQTQATAGRKLYYIEVKTLVAYETLAGNASNAYMTARVYYRDYWGNEYRTEGFHFNEASESFLDKTAAMKTTKNQDVDAFSILLPAHCVQVTALEFEKDGGPLQSPKPWKGCDLRVDLVSGSIGGVVTDMTGRRFRSHEGTIQGFLSTLDQLNYKGEGSYKWTIPQVLGDIPAHNPLYVLEIITGDNGFPYDATITLSYKSALGRDGTVSFPLVDTYCNVFPNSDVDPNDKDRRYYDLPGSWLDTSDKSMQSIGYGYMGNYYPYGSRNTPSIRTALFPYTSTSLIITLPAHLTEISSVTIQLGEEEDDGLTIQDIRFIELSRPVGIHYFNGAFSLERTADWEGQLLSKRYRDTVISIPARGSAQFTADHTAELYRLESYPKGSGPWVDNSGLQTEHSTGVGVSMQISDTLRAGIESLLARNATSADAGFFAADKISGSGASAWTNLSVFVNEPLTLNITYKDTLGATRKVSIPFVTTYLCYLLIENGGDLSGSSGDYTTWISGVFQQNENIALPLRLAQYQELVSMELVYGEAPWRFGSLNQETVDCMSDALTVENLCFYEGVTRDNFNLRYQSDHRAGVLETSLVPAYHYQAPGDGLQLGKGSRLTAKVEDGLLQPGGPDQRSYEDTYLVTVQTSGVETAGTADPVYLSFGYTDSAGISQQTNQASLVDLTAAFYGISCRTTVDCINDQGQMGGPERADQQYRFHMEQGDTCAFLVRIPDLGTLDTVTLTLEGSDNWQMESIGVYQVKDLGQRTGTAVHRGSWYDLVWDRSYTADESNRLALARVSTLLYDRSNSKTIRFDAFNSEGEMIQNPEDSIRDEEFITNLPTDMTYEDTLGNLGLDVVKYNYQVSVKVADVEDAGSGNYFYFQLMFESGDSGVVLANQQLASDTFRQGMIESFTIGTTQYYGAVKGVRIICDRTATTSDVFDKLNIEQITINLSNDSGATRSWIIEQVGWIDITYADEGASYSIDGIEELTGMESAQVELVKEFRVSRSATGVQLLFCLTTGNQSATTDSSGLYAYQEALKGSFGATLYYRDSSNVQQSYSFDLIKQIQESYNNTSSTDWLFRPNRTDRFVLSLLDAKSIESIQLTRSGGSGTWHVKSVSVQQVGGLGEVTLCASNEYWREPINPVDLAQSSNEAVFVAGDGNAFLNFTPNSINVVDNSEDLVWNTEITRVPVSSKDTLHIYLYPGRNLSSYDSFDASTPTIRAGLTYTTVFGGRPMLTEVDLDQIATKDGQNILCATVEISSMAALNYLSLNSPANGAGNYPTVGYAIVEQVKEGVLMETYRFDFNNYNLLGGTAQRAPDARSPLGENNQVVQFQLAPDQQVALVPETSDIAVALHYTSTSAPDDNPEVYRSPYVYLTDLGLNSLTGGQLLEIPFQIPGMKELMAVEVVSTGPSVEILCGRGENYRGSAETNAPETLVSRCFLPDSFVPYSVANVQKASAQNVVPVTLEFYTPSGEIVANSGTSGEIALTLTYTGEGGSTHQVELPNLLAQLPPDTAIGPDSRVSLTFLAPDVDHLTQLLIQAGPDDWFIGSLVAQAVLPDGSVTKCDTTVNAWSVEGSPLTVDIRPESARDGEEIVGNRILSFAVSGRSTSAQDTGNASAGSALSLEAYPGDTVYLTPTITVQGQPESGWVWDAGSVTGLNQNSDGSATLRVGGTIGTTYDFTVWCKGNNTLAVPITVTVVEEPPPPEIPDSLVGG